MTASSSAATSRHSFGTPRQPRGERCRHAGLRRSSCSCTATRSSRSAARRRAGRRASSDAAGSLVSAPADRRVFARAASQRLRGRRRRAGRARGLLAGGMGPGGQRTARPRRMRSGRRSPSAARPDLWTERRPTKNSRPRAHGALSLDVALWLGLSRRLMRGAATSAHRRARVESPWRRRIRQTGGHVAS